MFTYDYAGRLASSTYPSVFSGTISDAYGPDGLLTKRTWPTNSETGTLTYDGAKRPTQVTYGALSSSLTEAYDRDGNVVSEGRSLTGVTGTTGDAGAHTQSLVYDKLNRVASASGLTAGSSSYTYDLDFEPKGGHGARGGDDPRLRPDRRARPADDRWGQQVVRLRRLRQSNEVGHLGLYPDDERL